jgi:hypothetical protein
MPKSALVDKTGSFMFPYKDTWNRYRYSDGIVSLTGDSNYSRSRFYDRTANASIPDTVGFWKLDGTPSPVTITALPQCLTGTHL